jgi:hypothetical protein
MRHQHPFLASLLVALTVASAAAQSTQVPPAQPTKAPPNAKREQRPGLPQFGIVSDQLSRGAQPQDQGFAELKSSASASSST